MILGGIRFGLYPRLGDPTNLFRQSRRSERLRHALQIILVLGVVVYLAMLAVRIPILLSITGAVPEINEGLGFRVLLGWLPAALFVVTIACEAIVVTHLLFYLNLCRQGATRYRPLTIPSPPLLPPKVALLIPACDEPEEILERPLRSLSYIRYAACRPILVENSRNKSRKKAALALAERYGIEVIDLPNRGTKAAALNDARSRLDPDTKYLAVLDADQKLCADLVSDLVAILEKNPEVTWIQTAQSYEDASESLLRCAAGQQLLILYDSALEGKDVHGVCPILGTNYLLRLAALDAVGGWDETYVNEDTPTAYAMQLQGGVGRYLQRLYAQGLAPPTLEALWKQQARWAHSNSRLALSILAGFFRRGRRPVIVVADYLALSGYELVLFCIAFLSIVPALALVGSFMVFPESIAVTETVGRWQWAFASLYPFYLLLLFFPHINMGLRGYPIQNLVLLQGITSSLGPVYLSGVRRALFGQRPIFESAIRRVRPKERGRFLRWLITPQVVAFLVFIIVGSIAVTIGFQHPGSPFPWIVAFWTVFHAVALGHYFLFVHEDALAMHRTKAESAGAPQA